MHERPTRAAAATLALALAFAGCGGRGHDARATRLVDGSRPSALPRALGSLGRDSVTSNVRVLQAGRLDGRDRACIASFRSEFTVDDDAIVVERTGATGASLTFLDGSRHVVLGCDRTDRRRAGGLWCARSVGRLVHGRLEDPRLDILCVDRRGEPIGFAWIEPAPESRWVVVHDAAGGEIEPVAAGLPVRVATRDVDATTSSATFAVTEYDSTGVELARYRLPVRIAG